MTTTYLDFILDHEEDTNGAIKKRVRVGLNDGSNVGRGSSCVKL